jgi:hypothetical protein
LSFQIGNFANHNKEVVEIGDEFRMKLQCNVNAIRCNIAKVKVKDSRQYLDDDGEMTNKSSTDNIVVVCVTDETWWKVSLLGKVVECLKR